MKISSIKTILVCGTAIAGLVVPSAVFAQDEPGAATGGDRPIVVTGSRIKQDGFSSTVPLTVVGAETIENLGQTNAADVVRLIPQNVPTQSDATSGISTAGSVGSQFANLRGLNPGAGTRTLTLVNTRRFVPSSDGGQVDLNLIPSIMIGRVETVTGGASAAYGSDAIAGVVNIILDNQLEGFKAQVDYGQTARGDGKSYHAAGAYGLSFADGRGHILVGGEYQKNEGIGQCYDVRDWCAEGWGTVANSGAIRADYNRADRTTLNQNQAGRSGASNTVANTLAGSAGAGLPRYIVGPNLGLVYNSIYGTIRNFYQAGSATGTVYSAIFPAVNPPPELIDKVFAPDGRSVSDYNPGVFGPKLVGGAALGGDNESSYGDQYIQTPVKRYSLYFAGEYEFSDALKFYTELSYAERNAHGRSVTAATRSTMTIRADNAFLPPALSAIMNAPQTTTTCAPYACAPMTFSFGKDMDGEFDNEVIVDAEVFRGMAGAGGELFSDWTWDLYYQYGKTKRFSAVQYARHNDRFFMAIDAVRSDPNNPNSAIICRGLPQPGDFNYTAYNNFSAAYKQQLQTWNAACKPLNLFGAGNASDEAIDFAYDAQIEDFNYRQHVIAGNVQGTVFDGIGAGPVGVAVGVDYRNDKGTVLHGTQIPSEYAFSFGLDYGGTIEVLEGYAEANIPVFRDFVLGDFFELNGAVRYTKNTSTNTILNQSRSIKATSWKAGGIFDVVSGLRLRATQSHDIRAAGFLELFQYNVPTEEGTAQGRVLNRNLPSGSQDDATPIYTGGSFLLNPEAADTTTAGVVLAPDFIPGFQLSVDWYQIKMKEAIYSLAAQTIVDNCYNFSINCDRITFASPTNITRVDAGQANVGSVVLRGFDAELSYQLPLMDVGLNTEGVFDTRFLLTHQYDYIVQSGPTATPTDYAGQTGPSTIGNFSPTPKWQWNWLLGYNTDRFNATLGVRHIGKGKLNTDRIGPEDAGYSPTGATSITTNRVASATYFNIAMSYQIPIGSDEDQGIEVFATVENLFDKKPPVAPSADPIFPAAYPTNPVYFDTFGMRWKAGMRVKF